MKTTVKITASGLAWQRHGGVRLAGGDWIEGVSGLSFTTTSTNAAWTPTTVTKTGGTLTWRVYSATGALLLESIANKPTFNLSSYAGTKTLRVTSPDGWAALTALNFTSTTASIASLNLSVATGLTSLILISLAGLTWTVGAAAPMPTSLTYLYLQTLTGLTWTVGAAAPMPTGLTSLTLYNLAGLTWTVGAAAPMPTGLTSLTLYNLAGLTWTVGVAAPMPTGLTTLYLYNLAGLTWTVGVAAPMPTVMQTLTLLSLAGLTPIDTWAINSYRTIVYENNLTQAQLDTILIAIWTNKANYTYATPTLDIAGTGNAAPSGTYQSTCPPVTGKEYAYDLTNGICTSAGPEWVVTYTA